MPPLPPASAVLKINIRFLGPVGNFSVRHFMTFLGGPPSATDIQGFAAKVFANVGTQWTPKMTSNLAIDQVVVEDLTSTSSPVGIATGSHQGTRVGTPVTLNTCLVIDHLILRRYRGGKPKIFLPWGAQGDLLNAARWTDTFVTDCSQTWNQIYIPGLKGAVGNLNPTNPVSVGYYSGFTPKTDPVTGRTKDVPKLRTTPAIDLITGDNARAVVGSQRRRRTTG